MTKKRVGIAILIIAAIGILCAFYFVALRTPKSVEETKITKKDELLHMDIAANYPATPREVLKLYNRYVLLLYGSAGEELSEEEIEALAKQMRALYDEELLSVNTESVQLLSLSQELSSYKTAEKTMLQANVCGSNEVEYIDIDGADGARAQASYFIKEDSKNFTRTYEQFLFRKDADGKWKILGFEKIAGEEE